MPNKKLFFVGIIFFLLIGFTNAVKFEILYETHSVVEHEVILSADPDYTNEDLYKFFEVFADEVFDLETEMIKVNFLPNKNEKEKQKYKELIEEIKNKREFVDLKVEKSFEKDYKYGKQNIAYVLDKPVILNVKYRTKPKVSNAGVVSSGYWQLNPSNYWTENWKGILKVDLNVSAASAGHSVLIILDENTQGYAPGKHKPDCSDIRVVNHDYSSEKPRYVAYCSNNEVWVWFKSDVVAGINTFFIVYDNQNASYYNNDYTLISTTNMCLFWQYNEPYWSCTSGIQSRNSGSGINYTTGGLPTASIHKSGLFFSVESKYPPYNTYVEFREGLGGYGVKIENSQNVICNICSPSLLASIGTSSSLRKWYVNISKDGRYLLTTNTGEQPIKGKTNIISYYDLVQGNVSAGTNTGQIGGNFWVANTSQNIDYTTTQAYPVGEFYNYVIFDGNKFYKNKVYYKTFTYDFCNNETKYFYLYDQNNLLKTTSMVCDGNNNFVEETYTFTSLGFKRLLIKDINDYYVDGNFIFDNSNPTINVDYNIINYSAEIKATCSDNYNHKLKLIIKQNHVTNNLIVNPNTLTTLNYPLFDGYNVFNIYCEDGAGNQSEIMSFETTNYKKRFYFVYNKTGVALTGKPNYVSADINNLYVFNTDNNTYQDMYNPGNVSYQYQTTNKNTNIYFLLTYNSQGLASIKNDFDIDVIPDGNIPICFENLQSFNEQRFVSSTKRKIILQNTTSKCYYFGSRTKYAIGDYYYVNAYLTPASYDLWIEDDRGEMQKISLVIGDQPQQINIDSLLLKTKEYQVIINNEHLSVRSACINNDCNALIIRYYNARQDNNSLTISIYRNTEQLYYFSANDANVNDAIVLVNTSDWNVGYDTFEIRASTKKQDGKTNLIKFYYNFKFKKSTQIDSSLILIGSFLIVFIGLTLVSAKASFGWFGIIILLIGLFVSTFTKQDWAITLFQAILLIILLFTMLIYRGKSEYS